MPYFLDFPPSRRASDSVIYSHPLRPSALPFHPNPLLRARVLQPLPLIAGENAFSNPYFQSPESYFNYPPYQYQPQYPPPYAQTSSLPLLSKDGVQCPVPLALNPSPPFFPCYLGPHKVWPLPPLPQNPPPSSFQPLDSHPVPSLLPSFDASFLPTEFRSQEAFGQILSSQGPYEVRRDEEHEGDNRAENENPDSYYHWAPCDHSGETL